ncbi:hypothetical protein HYT52_05270 [Candidatus Woesearchaeota archaeon]|nr:hypothetical protein [Candidatus Woesearchaeota archaeon]
MSLKRGRLGRGNSSPIANFFGSPNTIIDQRICPDSGSVYCRGRMWREGRTDEKRGDYP